jgi:phage head maturation protease
MKTIKTPLDLSFSIKVSATDFPKREITGRIVTWNEIGATSAGETKFLADSITFADSTKLLLEHRRESPIGFLKSYTNTPEGIDAVFSIANTNSGNDALVEASSKLRDGFSVGVVAEKYKNVDGVLTISASNLREVSLVTDPAIASARVSIAASENENSESATGATEAETTKPTEGENEMEAVIPTVTEAPADTVEASKVINLGHVPMATTKPRSPIDTHAKYLEHTIRATMNPDSESALWVRAANDSTSTVAGFIPTRQLTEVINGLSSNVRPSIDAISRGALPDAGMTFEIPKITAVPTVAVTAEVASPSETGTTSSFVSVSVEKFAGQNTLSVELIDRSSPVFFEELLRLMSSAYAKATNARVNAILVANATVDATTLSALPTATELNAYTARASASVYAGTQRFARNIIMGTGQWANAMALQDTTNRLLYNAGEPSNSSGLANGQSIRGRINTLDLYADASAPAADADGSMIVVDPDSYTWYESPTLRLQSNIIASGEVQVMYYGYGACAVKLAAGAFRNNK